MTPVRLEPPASWSRVKHSTTEPRRVSQSVMYLTADPDIASSISARSHTFLEIDHEKIYTAILLLSADSRRIVVSCKQKYVHEVLVNRLVNLAQDKCG